MNTRRIIAFGVAISLAVVGLLFGMTGAANANTVGLVSTNTELLASGDGDTAILTIEVAQVDRTAFADGTELRLSVEGCAGKLAEVGLVVQDRTLVRGQETVVLRTHNQALGALIEAEDLIDAGDKLDYTVTASNGASVVGAVAAPGEPCITPATAVTAKPAMKQVAAEPVISAQAVRAAQFEERAKYFGKPKGQAKVAKKVKVTKAAKKLKYVWTVNGKKVSTKRVLKVKKAYAGKHLRVAVIASGVATSSAVNYDFGKVKR